MNAASCFSVRRAIALALLAGSAFSMPALAVPTAELGLVPGDLRLAAAVNSQGDHAAAVGDSSTLVVWVDQRGRNSGSQTIQSDSDLLGVRVDANGSMLDPAPFVIAGGMGWQQKPKVAWNGNAWLVIYESQDPTEFYFETRLRGVRVSGTGAVLDPTPITFPPSQFSPDTIGLQVAGVNGQWLISRCVYHADGYGTYLAGQRINAAGTLLDPTPTMLNDWIYGQCRTVAIGSGAAGEYVVSGPDWTDGTTTKARRINQNLQPVGATFTLPSGQFANGPAIAGAPGPGELYVVWIKDYVNLVGSRVTLPPAGGGTLVNAAGAMLVSDFSQYHHTSVAHDGTQWWVEWGASDILRTIRINAGGTVLDANGGVLLPIVIGGNINTAYNPMLLDKPGAGASGVQLFWYDHRAVLASDANVFALPISGANVAGTEKTVSLGSASQRNPDLSKGPAGSSALVFVSEHANDGRVLVHMLAADGTPTLSEPIEVTRGATIGRAGIAFNGSVFMIAWDQGAPGLSTTQIKARRMNTNGTFIDAQPFDVMPGFNADVEALGSNFLVAGTRVATYPQTIFMVGARVNGITGALLDGPNGLSLGGGYVSGAPRVRTDGTQWFVAAHSQWSHDSSQGDAILAKVPASGPPTQAFNPTPIAGGSGDLDIAFSGNKYLLVWRNNSLANANNSIAGRIMNADGTFPAPPLGNSFVISEAAGRQLRPTVTWDGTTFIVAWDDQRNQQAFYDARTDVYAARVTESGQVLDPAGFPIIAARDGECSPALLSINGMTLAATTRFILPPAFGGAIDSYRVGLTRLGAPQCRADFNRDGSADFFDYLDFVAAFANESASADFNGDGAVDFFDYLDFVAAFAAGCA